LKAEHYQLQSRIEQCEVDTELVEPLTKKLGSNEVASPIVKGSVIRVEVEHLPKPASRTKKTLWPFWSGPGEPDLDRCWRASSRPIVGVGSLPWSTPKSVLHVLSSRTRLPWERPRDPGHPHPGTRAKGISTTSCDDRHVGQSTEIDEAWTRASQRNPKTAQKTLSGNQTGCVSSQPTFSPKLRIAGAAVNYNHR
jgi:hypothetical protein